MGYRSKQGTIKRGIANDREIKKCTTLLAIWEIQIKTTLRFTLTPVKGVKINNVSKDVEQMEYSPTFAESTNLYSTHWKSI